MIHKTIPKTPRPSESLTNRRADEDIRSRKSITGTQSQARVLNLTTTRTMNNTKITAIAPSRRRATRGVSTTLVAAPQARNDRRMTHEANNANTATGDENPRELASKISLTSMRSLFLDVPATANTAREDTRRSQLSRAPPG